MARIEAPNKEYNGQVGDVVFKDGVAETDNHAVITYCRNAGYTVDGDRQETEVEEVADPRDLGDGTEVVGTRLRDAAVDPRPEDFLPPTNAGKANPHGPEVVSPGIHGASGTGPIVPGPVGRFEQTEDGTQVVITDTEEQQRRETTAAEQVFLAQRPVPEVVAELGDDVQQPAPTEAATEDAQPPAGNASADEWRTYAVEQRGADPEQVAGMKRDELRDKYGPQAE